jgi:hypothetical protein
MASLIAWYRKNPASQKNALLNKNRVLNSKCPVHFAWERVKRGE